MTCCASDPDPKEPQPCCDCGPARVPPASTTRGDEPWLDGSVNTPAGRTPRTTTALSWKDHLGATAVRLNIGRMHYAIEPGLYAVGSPTSKSPVFVSANYKLSFDCLRRELRGIDAWIFVLDTKGINVWCAAGKGTFGTDEIVHRVGDSELDKIVSHRTLILPQLGAPGVAAHLVEEQCGFKIVYGPVRAADIPAFLAADMQATAAMRRVRFGLRDRLAVVPVELVLWSKWALGIAACLFVVAGLNRGGFDFELMLMRGGKAALLVLIALIGGGVLAPALLPWLPARSFSAKGAIVGIVLALVPIVAHWWPATIGGRLAAAAWLLLLPAMAAFVAMNFTGASTYTSLSGVRREMRIAVPVQIIAAVIGLGLWHASLFLN